MHIAGIALTFQTLKQLRCTSTNENSFFQNIEMRVYQNSDAPSDNSLLYACRFHNDKY